MAPKKGRAVSGKTGGNNKEANRKAANLGTIYLFIYFINDIYYHLFIFI